MNKVQVQVGVNMSVLVVFAAIRSELGHYRPYLFNYVQPANDFHYEILCLCFLFEQKDVVAAEHRSVLD